MTQEQVRVGWKGGGTTVYRSWSTIEGMSSCGLATINRMKYCFCIVLLTPCERVVAMSNNVMRNHDSCCTMLQWEFVNHNFNGSQLSVLFYHCLISSQVSLFYLFMVWKSIVQMILGFYTGWKYEEIILGAEGKKERYREVE